MENTETIQMLGQIPAIASAWGQVNHVYEHTIGSNSLAQFTISTAESAIQAVGYPIANRLPLETIDKFASNQIGRLQTNYPVITKPTDQLYSEGINLCTNLPKISVNQALNITNSTMSSLKEFSSRKVENIKDIGRNMVSRGSDVMGKAKQQSDYYLDLYLPEQDEDSKLTYTSLSDKVKRRMFINILKQLKDRSLTVDKLTQVLSILDGCSIENGKKRLQSIWSQLNAMDDDFIKQQIHSNAANQLSFEQRAIITARHLSVKLKHSYSKLFAFTHLMPTIFYQALVDSKMYIDELYNSLKQISVFQEISKFALQHIRNNILDLMATSQRLLDSIIMSGTLSFMPRCYSNRLTESSLIEPEVKVESNGIMNDPRSPVDTYVDASDKVDTPNGNCTNTLENVLADESTKVHKE